ncbi:unnamed protein product [Plutella xylostella]|uniref:(diamondback moth) hypothetical protein n=1 Tax=Plutella xylostella TaxID=51655 RepID=A0A8S4E4E1_PLUXY|nr:unnamed protein product [Plutella xylostella]
MSFHVGWDIRVLMTLDRAVVPPRCPLDSRSSKYTSKMVNIDYNSKFLMTKSKRASSGRYVIRAKNEVGEDEAEVDITILASRSGCKYTSNIVNIDYNSKFLMTKSKRASSGRYVIRAKNEVGEDEAEVDITILGKTTFLLYREWDVTAT